MSDSYVPVMRLLTARYGDYCCLESFLPDNSYLSLAFERLMRSIKDHRPKTIDLRLDGQSSIDFIRTLEENCGGIERRSYRCLNGEHTCVLDVRNTKKALEQLEVLWKLYAL
jgi:hypothetical protein